MAPPRQTRSPDRTLRNGDGRVARLARWIGKSPAAERFDTLVLEVQTDGEWSRLQAWERSSVNEALADQIDLLVTEHANETGSYLRGRVAWWCSSDGTYWTSHDLRVQPEMGDGEGPQQVLSGDAQSAMIQTQRHLELMVRTHVGGFSTAMQALQLSVSGLSTANADLRSLSDRLSEENMQLRAQVMELEHALEQAVGQAETLSEQAQSSDKEHNIIQLATKALERAGAGAKTDG